MIKAIYLFYLFKFFAPKTIDNRSTQFWRSSVKLLNEYRSKSEGFALWKRGRFYLRDPHSIPVKTYFIFFKNFPLVIRRG